MTRKPRRLPVNRETLKQLDGMKGSLPTSLQDKIDAAKGALAAKKAEGMFK